MQDTAYSASIPVLKALQSAARPGIPPDPAIRDAGRAGISFELLLNAGLRREFDAISKEPLPDAFLTLLDLWPA